MKPKNSLLIIMKKTKRNQMHFVRNVFNVFHKIKTIESNEGFKDFIF